ncbi:MAG: hypothetical protein K8H86_00865 [Ignavibacteriaceae bacterium]|nr:hypothetical protein [Ignavibacteriaceae bacterium]
MKKNLYFLAAFIFVFILSSCSSEENNPVQPPPKTYDVEYKLSGSVSEINQINYLAANGQLLHDSLVTPSWSYQWTSKGKEGQQTSLEAVLVKQSGKLLLEILADGNHLVNDSISGIPGGRIMITRSITLPYE